MPKFVNETHITGDKGVAAFHTYCAHHRPYILWKPETVNDFGIDGEVELTSHTLEGKLEATGEIVKVQIKSTLKGSYIHKEDAMSFQFKPRTEDVEYWNKHRLEVILVIYDDRTGNLYAKKIDQLDHGFNKQNIPIEINKETNLLKQGESKFIERFSSNFKQRLRFDIKEILSSNLFKFNKLPKYVYRYDPKLENPKQIFDSIPNSDRPIFLFREKMIHSFFDAKDYPSFQAQAVKYESHKPLLVRDLIKDVQSRRLVSELLNLEFKDACFKKGIGFNKQYHRYYFMLKGRQSQERIEYYDGRAKRKDTHRTVVAYKEYGSQKFYRHFAFETKFLFADDGIYLVINPQYLFTSDAKNPLEDKKAITTLTNYLTSRERTQQIFNHVHFIFSFLANGGQKLSISVFPGSEIEIFKYQEFTVNFGIPLDNKQFDKPLSSDNSGDQQTLFG